MRVLSRFALILVVVLSLAAPLAADHFIGQCPLSLVDQTTPTSRFADSPHGVFTSGNNVFVLRGNTITTYNRNDAGDLQIVRSDQLGSLGARESIGAAAFSNGFLYLSSEAGFEIFDLTNMTAGGIGPVFKSRTANLHYRRLAVNGNMVVGLYPATSLPCSVTTNSTRCTTFLDFIGVANPLNPVVMSSYGSAFTQIVGFNDLAFVRNGWLVVTGTNGTLMFDVTNPFQPQRIASASTPGTFLVTNGFDLVGVGTPGLAPSGQIDLYAVADPAGLGLFARYTIAPYLTIDRANAIAFHPQAFLDDANGRLITLVDEIDPLTGDPARTIAFDIFDYTVPQLEGSAPREYEALSFVVPDEVKSNPVAVGPYVYTVGEVSGVQEWGACDQVTGHIDWNTIAGLLCGGAELHGWVTGTQKIANVEIFLDNTSLGFADLTGPIRTDVDTRTPAVPWRITVNLDTTAKGDHTIRAVGTDILGNRRQFAIQRVFFPGPGSNCVPRRGRAIRAH